jgi:glycosyltransferase involved in cell wall biosynthesis
LRSLVRRFDVAVAHGSRSLPASAIALAGTDVPFVYKNIGDTAYWSASPLRRMRVSLSLRRAAAIVAMTDGAKRSLLDHHGLADSRVIVIPSWRPASRFPPVNPDRRKAARLSLGLRTDEMVYLIMGALTPEKRVGLAIEAVAGIPNARLLVVGQGPERASLDAQAERLMPGRAVFTGLVDEPETVFPAADVVVLSSASEGVPGVLIEGGLSGLPSVAFDVGGVAAVLAHGRTGLLVPTGDVGALREACQEAYRDRERMGRLARHRCAAEFDLDRAVGHWYELLERVARGHGAHRGIGGSSAATLHGADADEATG